MREYTSKKDGAVKVPAPFKLDGVEFNGAVSFLDILPLADFATIEFDAKGQLPPQAAQSLVEFFKAALGDDYERFAKHVRQHGTEPLTLLQVMMDLMEDASAGLFPTGPSSPSPGGDGGTGPMSPAALAELSEVERNQLRALAVFAKMRHQAAREFGTTPPPLPPGLVPTEGRPQVKAIIDALLTDPTAPDRLESLMSGMGGTGQTEPRHPSLPI